MNDKECDKLINKAKDFLPYNKLKTTDFEQLEQLLKVVLPEDFKYINNQYSYNYLNYFEMCSFPLGVILKTQELREACNLPKEYVVFCEDNTYMLMLKTISSTQSEVIFCNPYDFYNLCEGKPLEYNPTIFKSFADFFEFLLDEEEKLRAEDAELNKD